MDVDGAAGELAAHIVRQNLHIASEHEQIGLEMCKQREQLLLLIFLPARLDRQIMEGKSVPFHQRRCVS